MEVSCKAAAGKSIAAFPDTCMTPPQTPATPPGVPIPYPNNGLASDCTSGSSTVQISGQEVMLKDKSYFKTSSGDEAGCAPMKGLITHQNTGKVYFTAWSMDVKVEGENVVRMQDLTTHNHASVPGNAGPWLYIDDEDVPSELKEACGKDKQKEKTACKDYQPPDGKDPCAELSVQKKKGHLSGKGITRDIAKPRADALADETALHNCLSARRCALQPYSPNTCCNPQTGHHLIEASALFDVGRGGEGSKPLQGVIPKSDANPNGYSEAKAPCVCAEGTSHKLGGTHELMHALQSLNAVKQDVAPLPLADGGTVSARATTYGKAKESAAATMQEVFQDSHCDDKCIKAQLDAYHRQCGLKDDTPIKAVVIPEDAKLADLEATAARARQEANNRFSEVLADRMNNADWSGSGFWGGDG
jgi:Domain of unknown function (DUF4150)/GHH signature containing HNH/Endo VII superfamily nuclease toxin  2